MDKFCELIFPKVVFSGAFLTDDLCRAFILPLAAKAAEFDMALTAGRFFVQLVDGFYYEAIGEAEFDGISHRITIRVQRTTAERCEFADIVKRIPEGDQLLLGIGMARVFLGVDKEPYALGIIEDISP